MKATKWESKSGEEKGIKKNKIAIAKKLLNIGMQITQIQEITGLTQKEIQALNCKKQKKALKTL